MWKKILIFMSFVPVIIAVITLVIGIFSHQLDKKSYELEDNKYREGQISPKKLEIYTSGGTNITSLFNSYTDETFSIYLAGKELKNLYSIMYRIKNTGEAPILESDFSENLTLTFSERWKILVFKNEDIAPPEFNPVWERISNHEIQLKPLLINAKDKFDLEIYLSDTKEKDFKTVNIRDELQGKWTVRIPKLSKIDIDDPSTRRLEYKKPKKKISTKSILKELLTNYYVDRFGAGMKTLFKAGFLIMPNEWGVYAILTLAAIMIFVYLNLLYPLKVHFNLSKQSSIFSIIGISVFSFAASETYITFFVALGINVALINYIFMFLYVASIIILIKINGKITKKGAPIG